MIYNDKQRRLVEMSLAAIAAVPDDVRTAFARRIKYSDDFTLPHMTDWNYSPCKNHSSIDEGSMQVPPCQRCGIIPRKHQRIGIAWAFTAKKVLVADQTGTGKTIHGAGLLALIRDSGELAADPTRKVLIVVSSALHQWKKELKRMLPDVPVALLAGKIKSKRLAEIQSDWQIGLTTYQTLNNDIGVYRGMNLYGMIIDDVDPIRNPVTKTAKTIKELSVTCERIMEMNATPLQKRLYDLYFVLEPVGAEQIFGSPAKFDRRYIKYHYKKVYDPKLKRELMMKNIAGYRNLDELKELIDPFVIRRTAADIDDVNLPVLTPNEIYFDLYPAQRLKYEQLRKGIIRILTEEGASITKTRAQNAYMLGQQICDGLAVLGEADAALTSVKFDWLENQLVDGDLSDDKVVVFLQFQNGIKAMSKRLRRADVKHDMLWGVDNKAAQFKVQERFWKEDDLRVLLCTSAAERSVNLQVAQHLVAVDTLPNPSRMTQIAGRIKRDGSSFSTVFFHSLLTNDTQEARYIARLQREQAVSDVVFDDKNDLYTSGFSDVELLRMISG